MAGFARAKILLKENALRVIHMLEPGTGVLRRFANDGVHRAARRAKGIFDDERAWMLFQHFLSLEAVLRDVRLGERNLEIAAKFAREISLAFNPHSLTGRTENRNFPGQQFILPGGQCPVDRHWHD